MLQWQSPLMCRSERYDKFSSTAPAAITGWPRFTPGGRLIGMQILNHERGR